MSKVSRWVFAFFEIQKRLFGLYGLPRPQTILKSFVNFSNLLDTDQEQPTFFQSNSPTVFKPIGHERTE